MSRLTDGVATVPGLDFDTEVGNRFTWFSFAGAPAEVSEALAARLEGWLG